MLCNETATTEIYTLSLHDALPILYVAIPESLPRVMWGVRPDATRARVGGRPVSGRAYSSRRKPTLSRTWRSEEHTSELQSRRDLVCRLLLEKKKKKTHIRSFSQS